ncbi:tripartite tricarboxylate transporter substrate-binding protein [uncultured Desulfovibrio sp.]|uniref:tripartite tricarboxylate transporter substrate-binding protein n=1 Tax=uncultured Desulfovibrio sp. TaxID=167968 RepID=UPI00261DB8F0|nr:tripartite tricarboxylate transporter substrate-binding protein [uncultured Desulfovibrio sp.]
MLMVEKKLGAKLPHVAYTSGHDVSTALLGGHIASAFGVTTNQLPYVQAGDFRIIGVTSKERVKELPDAPPLPSSSTMIRRWSFPRPTVWWLPAARPTTRSSPCRT